MDTARRRVDLLATLPAAVDAVGLEYADALAAAADTALANGDLTGARAYAEQARQLPFLREEGHLATARMLIVDALTGDWDETVELADQFQTGWRRAGRPVNATLSRGAYAAATIFGIRGDVTAYTTWQRIAHDLTTDHRRGVQATFTAVFDALYLLHHERPGDAHAHLNADPQPDLTFHNGLWRGWHAALRAEAAVLAASATAPDAIAHATATTTDNPVAATITLRAAALAGNDRTTLLTTADTLHRLGSRYQAARTLVLAGDPERAQGQAQFAQPPLQVLDHGSQPEQGIAQSTDPAA